VLAPVVVNIAFFHAFLAPGELGLALAILALEVFLAWSYRSAFRPMLARHALPDAASGASPAMPAAALGTGRT
jgi:hypothetical protein